MATPESIVRGVSGKGTKVTSGKIVGKIAKKGKKTEQIVKAIKG